MLSGFLRLTKWSGDDVPQPTRYTFVRTAGTRDGELHRERAGFVKFVAYAHLTPGGWLVYGNGAWLRAGTFRIQSEPLRVPVVVLARVIAESMAHAARLLAQRDRKSA